MQFDLVVHGGKIVSEDSILEADIGVKDGKIHTVARNIDPSSASTKLDATNKYVFPGLLDVHTHLRDLGRSNWGTFETETRAALAGGVTTALDMPNNVPPAIDIPACELRVDIGQKKTYINLGFVAGAGIENIPEISKLASSGLIFAFKSFMRKPPGLEREKEFIGTLAEDDGIFHAVAKHVAKTNLPYLIHCESAHIVGFETHRLITEGKNDLAAYEESKPQIIESLGVARALEVSGVTAAKLHICHMTAERSVIMTRWAKKQGRRITAETCGNHIFFTIDQLEQLRHYAKISPPLRKASDIAALWEGLLDGTIECIVSDHAPFSVDDVDAGKTNIWQGTAGWPGIEVLLPQVLSYLKKGVIDLNFVAKKLAVNPAKHAGLYPQKGVVRPGSDADLTMVDPKLEWTVNIDKLETMGKDTAFYYDKLKLTGKATATILNGVIAMQDGHILTKAGSGKVLRRNPAAM